MELDKMAVILSSFLSLKLYALLISVLFFLTFMFYVCFFWCFCVFLKYIFCLSIYYYYFCNMQSCLFFLAIVYNCICIYVFVDLLLMLIKSSIHFLWHAKCQKYGINIKTSTSYKINS